MDHITSVIICGCKDGLFNGINIFVEFIVLPFLLTLSLLLLFLVSFFFFISSVVQCAHFDGHIAFLHKTTRF